MDIMSPYMSPYVFADLGPHFVGCQEACGQCYAIFPVLWRLGKYGTALGTPLCPADTSEVVIMAWDKPRGSKPFWPRISEGSAVDNPWVVVM